jgi:hypothetical protein
MTSDAVKEGEGIRKAFKTNALPNQINESGDTDGRGKDLSGTSGRRARNRARLG